MRSGGAAGLPAPALAWWMRWRVWMVPAVVLLAVALPKLGQGDWRSDTGWYSAIAHQAVSTGSAWTLHAEPGVPYFNKPPAAFWVHGVALRLGGTSLEVARLPTILAAVGVVLATVGIGRTLAGPRVGYASGVVCALSYEFFRRTREFSLDMWQALWLMLAVWCVAVAWRRDRSWLVLVGGVFVGFALMTKPLVGLIAIPMLVAWAAWLRWWRGAVLSVAAMVIAVAVALPWHWSMVATHGDAFVDQYFGREIAGRVEEKLEAGPPWWNYGKLIARGYWPWLVFLLPAVVLLVKGRGLSRSAGLASLAVVWACGWLVVLSVFPDKRPRYALVLWPALAWLVGAWLVNRSPPRLRRGKFGLDAVAGVVVLGGIVVSLLPMRVQGGANPQWGDLFAWMRDRGVERGELWQGSFIGTRGARVYLEFGWWPEPTRGLGGRFIADPPEGALLAYHADDGLAMGPGEVVVFESDKLRVTRLEEGPWRPVPGGPVVDDGR